MWRAAIYCPTRARERLSSQGGVVAEESVQAREDRHRDAMRVAGRESVKGSAAGKAQTIEAAYASIVLELARIGDVLEEIRDALKGGRVGL